jgi:hypothetical protein
LLGERKPTGVDDREDYDHYIKSSEVERLGYELRIVTMWCIASTVVTGIVLTFLFLSLVALGMFSVTPNSLRNHR